MRRFGPKQLRLRPRHLPLIGLLLLSGFLLGQRDAGAHQAPTRVAVRSAPTRQAVHLPEAASASLSQQAPRPKPKAQSPAQPNLLTPSAVTTSPPSTKTVPQPVDSLAPVGSFVSTANCANVDEPMSGSAAEVAGFLCLMNDVRTAVGVGLLAPQAQLVAASQSKASDIQTCDDFSHYACGRTLNGQPAWDYWIKTDGYSGFCWGENLAAGFPTARSAFTGLMNSAGHRENILRATYDDEGTGLTFSPTMGWIWATEFGGC